MINTSNLDSIGAKLEEIMDKKICKFKIALGSANVSYTYKKPVSCRICGGTNQDRSYYEGSDSKHVSVVDYGVYNQEGAPVMNYDGYGYNPYCVADVGYGGQNQGYAHQSSYKN